MSNSTRMTNSTRMKFDMTKSGMKKVARFVFDTAYGPFVAWCCTALLLFASYALSPLLGNFGFAMVRIMYAMLLVAAVVNVAAIIKSLADRQSGRGLFQLLLALAGLLLFFFGFLFSFVACGVVAHAISSGYAEVRSAGVTNESAAVEFAVEYRPAHPFLAEYDKCIVFPSGKRVGINMDTGGAGAFAVYRLPTGEYYLVDGLDCDFARNDYRVNAANETVEIMCEATWINIPDGALAVTGHGNMGVIVKMGNGEMALSKGAVPVGDSLKGRVYVGLLYPSGDFEPGTGDPFADIIEPQWKSVKLSGG